MKHINKIKIFLLINICFLTLMACSIFTPNQDFSEQNKGVLREDILVESVCELFENRDDFNNKVVTLKTILFRIGSFTTFADQKCETRHPLVSVEFSPTFESFICNSNDVDADKLCLIAEATKQNKGDVNFKVLADFIGHFDYYRTNEGFNLDDVRFRFIITDVRNIKKISPIKTEKLN